MWFLKKILDPKWTRSQNFLTWGKIQKPETRPEQNSKPETWPDPSLYMPHVPNSQKWSKNHFKKKMDSKDGWPIINVIIAIFKQQVIWHASGVDQQTLQEVSVTHCSKKSTNCTLLFCSLIRKKIILTFFCKLSFITLRSLFWKKYYMICSFWVWPGRQILGRRICKMVRQQIVWHLPLSAR